MNILITGCNGQLGNEMRVLSAQHPRHNYFFTDVAELDITDRQAVSSFVTENAIDLIVNCAAYTNVDKAEEDEATALKINADALAVLGSQGIRVIHISTDYVFSGDEHIPCREADPVAPRTAYGRTKLEGEKRLLAVCPEAVILRTAWLYSSFGNNFVKTMIRLGQEKESLGVVFDQIGVIGHSIRDKILTFKKIQAGIICADINDSFRNFFHRTGFSSTKLKINYGVCSWYDFTLAIHELAGITKCRVRPILSEEYQYRTPRPHYSVLDKSKFKKTFGAEIPHWTDGLKRCMEKL